MRRFFYLVLFVVATVAAKAQAFQTPTVSALSFCGGGSGSSGVRTTGSALSAACYFVIQLSNSSGSFSSGVVNIGTTAPTTYTSASTAINISFTIPANTVTGSAYRIRVVAQNASTNVVMLTGTNNGSNITITTPTVTTPATQVFCPGTAAVNFTTGGGATSLAWTSDNTAIGLAASGTGNLAFTAANTGNATASALVTITPKTASCTGTSSSFTVTVNPVPAMSGLTNVTVCNGGTVPASSFAATVSGSTFAWTNGNTAIGLGASGSGNTASFIAVNSGTTAATATVNVTPSYTSGGKTCAGTASSYVVTVNPTPSATVSYPNASYCPEGTATPSFSGTTGGSWSAGAGLSINSASGAVDLGASTSGTYTVTYSVPAAGGCAAYATTTPLTVQNYSTWTGSVSTDWSNAANWCGPVPNGAQDALVPSVTNLPVISANASVRNLTIQSGATVTVNSAALNATGSVSGAGTLINNAASQVTLPAAVNVNNLTVSGGGKLVLSGNTVVNGNVNFVNGGGRIVLGNNDLTFSGVVGGGPNAYMITNGTGRIVRKNLNGTQVFHVAAVDGAYAPLTITHSGNLDWKVGIAATISPVATNMSKAIQLQWNITPSATPSTGATLVFQYDESNAAILGSQFNTGADVVVNHYNGTRWETVGSPVTPSGTPGGIRTVTIGGRTEFSPYALSNIGSPLPVSLMSFSGEPKSSGYLLHWSTASESDCLGFRLQRSGNGRDFTDLAFVASAAPGGNSSSVLSYGYADMTAGSGDVYYRLVQQDRGGRVAYSRALRFGGVAYEALSVFPNPASSQLNIRMVATTAGPVELALINAAGSIVLRNTTNLSAGANLLSLPVAALPAGAYQLQVRGAGDAGQRSILFVKN